MRCEHCNEREATTHIKKIINGNKTELHLCSECAAELGVAEEFSPENFFADTFFGNLLGAGIPAMNVLSGVERCESCGSSFNDIVKNGSVGCAHCYEKLEPSIVKIHGKTKHVGKNVTYTVDESEKAETPEDKAEKLKEKLKQAIKEQRFEDAAELRDKIKELNQEG